MTENAKRVAMTAKALEVCRALVDDDFPTFADRERFMRWLDSVEILPNPEPAPAEALEKALDTIVSYALMSNATVSDETEREIEGLEELLTSALRRLAELERSGPTQEQVRAAWEAMEAIVYATEIIECEHRLPASRMTLRDAIIAVLPPEPKAD